MMVKFTRTKNLNLKVRFKRIMDKLTLPDEEITPIREAIEKALIESIAPYGPSIPRAESVEDGRHVASWIARRQLDAVMRVVEEFID